LSEPSSTLPPGPFLVIGCGRSGTSYVGTLLHASGIDLGSDLKPSDQFNERAYFEDVPVTRLHQRWLAQEGMTLVSISDDFPLEGTAEMDRELREVPGPRLNDRVRWGMKPPGILFFWPSWERVVPSTTYLLLPFRHPRAFAQSYVAGTGDTNERALTLWLSLNRLALQAIDSSGFASLVLDFDQPATFAERLRPILGSVTDTYEGTLHHHRASAPLEGETAALYADLQHRARNGHGYGS
jgi:hypothetical protein